MELPSTVMIRATKVRRMVTNTTEPTITSTHSSRDWRKLPGFPWSSGVYVLSSMARPPFRGLLYWARPMRSRGKMRTRALPKMFRVSIIPTRWYRLSSDTERLSPSTNTQPSGTVWGNSSTSKEL